MKEMHGWRGSDPTNMLIIPTETVIKVAATADITVFVTACGQLYLGQYNGRDKGSLKQIDLGSKWVLDAAVYKGEIIFNTSKGVVYSLNIETEAITLINILEPKKTCSHGKEENGRKVHIKKISAGTDHILYLSSKNEIWVQGKGPALGLFTNKTENEIINPTRVDFFKGRNVVQAVAGHYFTMALVEELPLLTKSLSSTDSVADMDFFVRDCDQCRKETGNRMLFEETKDREKCPLGLGILLNPKSAFLSPAPSSTCLDGRLSRNSYTIEEGESSDYIDFDITSGETSCDGTTLNTPIESKVGMEMKTLSRLRKASNDSSFEVIENDFASKLSFDQSIRNTGALGMTRDAAKQFFSRPLSWVTNTSVDAEGFASHSDAFSYKYPIDSATEIIRENVATAASLVATSVRTVGDKVGQLSRHFSSTDCVEGTEAGFSPVGESLNIDMFSSKPLHNINKSESFEWNSYPRLTSSSFHPQKSHVRTGSMSLTREKKNSMYETERNSCQIETKKDSYIASGKNLMNLELWGWGSSNKGQLGLGDQNHRATPTILSALNHCGVKRVHCGSHHAAALTIDGEVYVWGGYDSNNALANQSLKPQVLKLPQNRTVQDLASGDDFLIVISLDGALFYLDIKSDSKSHLQAEEIYMSDPSAFFNSVLCQSQSIVCTSEEAHPKVQSYIEKESSYLHLLKKTVQHIVLPLMNLNNNNKTGDASGGTNNLTNIQREIQSTKRSLIKSYLSLTYIVASSLQELRGNLINSEISLALPSIHLVEEMTFVYKEYLTFFCNAIALSDLAVETKELESILEKSKVDFQSYFDVETKNMTDIFAMMFLLPTKRIEEHEKFLHDIRNDTENFYSPFSLEKIKSAHSQWKKLALLTASSKTEAETTRQFWSSCSPKLLETLATPSRRLVKDSRKTPINLYNAGRFSSHSFILLSDVLIHYSYNNFVTYNLNSMWVEALPNVINNQKNHIQVTFPEETLTLVCPNALDKRQWLQALQDGVHRSTHTTGEVHPSRSTPLVRNADHTFIKHPLYKDATYSGQWFCGKMQGQGTLSWPDGKRYSGQFRDNVYQGLGTLEVPVGVNGFNKYEGYWKQGKLEGRGVIRYSNNNIYVGFLKESQPHGHGEQKQGRFSSEAASVFTGEWQFGVKNGYGVLDEIAQGEKYHGMWQNNNRHGPGMVVTMNDVYYEGNFTQNKLAGFGLMILEDGTFYEGELGPGGICNGKGVLRYPNGYYIEGTFNGSLLSEGIKVNGVIRKGDETSDQDSPSAPKSFGCLSVLSKQKWSSLFKHCEEQMGILQGSPIETSKVWQCLASFIVVEKQALIRSKNTTADLLEGLDKIPEIVQDLTLESLANIQNYLEKAFSSSVHPLGQLMFSLVDAFRATYGGVVTHPRLLQFAVDEVWSFSSRLYRIVKILFPALPTEGDNLLLESEASMDEDVVVTSACVIHPWLLPHLYATLSPLYVRHHHRKDEEYWQRLLKWNKQSDAALMTFLGVDMKFWLPKGENLSDNSASLSSVDEHFTEAVETLQLLSTSFTPKDKLHLIRNCATMINQEVILQLGNHFVLAMDDLLPLFLYVVIRARIQHLGAEIGLIDDLIDPNLQHGELGHVFTTLKACYYHILHEKPSPSI